MENLNSEQIEQIKAQLKQEILEEQRQNSVFIKISEYLKSNTVSTYIGLGAGWAMIIIGYKSNDFDMTKTGIYTIMTGTAMPDATTLAKAIWKSKQ